jgi:hypothetical protein
VALQHVCAEGSSDFGHHRGRQDAAPDHITDHEHELSVSELDDVVPVPSDLDAGTGRQVLGAEAHARQLRQHVG